jgi:hypothetical protein
MREVGALLDAKAVHGGRSAYNHLLCLAQTNNLPRRRVGEVLELVGLTEVARRRTVGFSLGMSQRLGIAATAPYWVAVARKAASTTSPVTTGWAVTDSASREWSSSQGRISVSWPQASCQWMKSDCQHSFGWSARTGCKKISAASSARGQLIRPWPGTG